MGIHTSEITSAEANGNVSLNPNGSGKTILETNTGKGEDIVGVNNTGDLKSFNAANLAVLPSDPTDGDLVVVQRNVTQYQVDATEFGTGGGGGGGGGGIIPWAPTATPTASPSSVTYAALSYYGTISAAWSEISTILTTEGSLRLKVAGSPTFTMGPSAVGVGNTVELTWDNSVVNAAADGDIITGKFTSAAGLTEDKSFTVKRTPTAMDFTIVIDVAINSVSTSPTVIGDYNATTSVKLDATSTMTSPEVSINGGAFTTLDATEQFFNPGQSVQIRGTVGSGISTPYVLKVVIGTGVYTYTATTISAAPSISQPSIVSPVNNASGVGNNVGVTATASAYTPNNGAGTHLNSDWQTYANGYPLTSTNTITTVGTNAGIYSQNSSPTPTWATTSGFKPGRTWAFGQSLANCLYDGTTYGVYALTTPAAMWSYDYWYSIDNGANWTQSQLLQHIGFEEYPVQLADGRLFCMQNQGASNFTYKIAALDGSNVYNGVSNIGGLGCTAAVNPTNGVTCVGFTFGIERYNNAANTGTAILGPYAAHYPTVPFYHASHDLFYAAVQGMGGAGQSSADLGMWVSDSGNPTTFTKLGALPNSLPGQNPYDCACFNWDDEIFVVVDQNTGEFWNSTDGVNWTSIGLATKDTSLAPSVVTTVLGINSISYSGQFKCFYTWMSAADASGNHIAGWGYSKDNCNTFIFQPVSTANLNPPIYPNALLVPFMQAMRAGGTVPVNPTALFSTEMNLQSPGVWVPWIWGRSTSPIGTTKLTIAGAATDGFVVGNAIDDCGSGTSTVSLISTISNTEVVLDRVATGYNVGDNICLSSTTYSVVDVSLADTVNLTSMPMPKAPGGVPGATLTSTNSITNVGVATNNWTNIAVSGGTTITPSIGSILNKSDESNSFLIWQADNTIPNPTPGTVFKKSTDGGQTWTDLSSISYSLQSPRSWDANGSTVIIIGAPINAPAVPSEAVRVSTDGGASWTAVMDTSVTGNMVSQGYPLRATSVHYIGNNTWMCGISNSGICIWSTDNGATWTLFGSQYVSSGCYGDCAWYDGLNYHIEGRSSPSFPVDFFGNSPATLGTYSSVMQGPQFPGALFPSSVVHLPGFGGVQGRTVAACFPTLPNWYVSTSQGATWSDFTPTFSVPQATGGLNCLSLLSDVLFVAIQTGLGGTRTANYMWYSKDGGATFTNVVTQAYEMGRIAKTNAGVYGAFSGTDTGVSFLQTATIPFDSVALTIAGALTDGFLTGDVIDSIGGTGQAPIIAVDNTTVVVPDGTTGFSISDKIRKGGFLLPNTDYYTRVKYRSNDPIESQYSNFSKFTTGPLT